MAKIKKNYIYGGLLLVGLVLLFTNGDDAPKGKPLVKKAVVPANKKKDDYLPIDYKAHFASLVVPKQSAFSPRIKRTNLISEVPNAINTEDGAWQYGGMAAIDGNTSGLLQNQSRGDSVFVHIGESWHSYVVTDLSPEAITFRAEDGSHKTIQVPSEKIKEEPVAAMVEPVRPSITGPIGGPPRAIADNSAATADIPVEMAQTNDQNLGGGGRRRRRGGGE